ncbi:hypothetical protein HYALB_00012898 [Hymenoscyphus albidus]|uniref:Uncharacterized protein n=1 Tax=Hymenoscyphus albidus TaxID=595503 RepID=A0A9N9LTH4_9HELO|nr:hypothetical protein HYALB_00012898 [Hymenoscyphus albidus]
MANYGQADILCKITDLILEEWVAETSWKQLGFVSPDDILEILKLQLPAMDNITTGIASIEADRNKTIPLWFTLAYQILLDIRHVLGNRGAEAFSDLQESGSEISLGVKKYFDFSRTITGKSKTWHTDNDPQIRKLPQFNKDWLQRDFVVFAIKKHGKQRPMALDFDIMCPPYFLLKNHPLLCGSLQYWMHHCHRQWQISLTNCYDSILACAHLYNAARQSGFFTQNWTEMDQVVHIHGAQRIFIGAIPTTYRDFFTRFQMVLGASAVNFAGKTRAVMDGRRQPTQSNKSLGARRLRKTLPIHDVFEGRYTRLEKQSDLSVHKIDALIASMKPSLHDHLVQPANTWTSTRKIHTNDLLMMLRLALSENIPELHFDYLSLHICCANFLSRLRSSFIANADNDFDSLYRAVSREDASRALELGLSQPSLALILRDIMLVDDKSLALHLVSSILLVHPDALKAAGGSFKNAELWSGVLTCSGVNLKVASDSLAMFLDTGDR